MKLNPDYIIGDLDSINPEVLKFYNDKCTIIKYRRQNDTDVEKCLKYAIKLGFREAFLIGATGNRIDHSFCNMGIMLKYFDKILIKMLHHEMYVSPYSGNNVIKCKKGEIISIYGFDNCTKITSTGLKYKLKNTVLKFGEKESTSNVALNDKIQLKVEGGIVFLVKSLNIYNF